MTVANNEIVKLKDAINTIVDNYILKNPDRDNARVAQNIKQYIETVRSEGAGGNSQEQEAIIWMRVIHYLRGLAPRNVVRQVLCWPFNSRLLFALQSLFKKRCKPIFGLQTVTFTPFHDGESVVPKGKNTMLDDMLRYIPEEYKLHKELGASVVIALDRLK